MRPKGETSRFGFILVLIVLLVGVTATATGALASPQDQRRYELVKCTSERVGTVWLSFGHLIRSGGHELETFTTELVYFGNDGHVHRKVWMDYREALKDVDVRARQSGLGVDFQTSYGERHSLTILQYSDVATAFVGNWSVKGIRQMNDQVGCTVH